MNIKKLIKVLLLTLGIMILIPGKSVLAYNEEVEPNDTLETATQVTRCTVTPQNVLDGTSAEASNFMSGGGKAGDVDWYSVTLYANTDNYFSFLYNNGLLNIYLYDSNGVLDKINKHDNVSARTTYNFEVPVTGTYYIQITSVIRSSFRLTVGNPLYRLGSYNMFRPSVALTKGTAYTDKFVLSKVSTDTIPDKAIAYHIMISGGTVLSTTQRSIKPSTGSTWLVSPQYLNEVKPSVSGNFYVKQSWDVQYVANKTETFSPVNTFYYVYPLLPGTSWDILY